MTVMRSPLKALVFCCGKEGGRYVDSGTLPRRRWRSVSWSNSFPRAGFMELDVKREVRWGVGCFSAVV